MSEFFVHVVAVVVEVVRVFVDRQHEFWLAPLLVVFQQQHYHSGARQKDCIVIDFGSILFQDDSNRSGEVEFICA